MGRKKAGQVNDFSSDKETEVVHRFSDLVKFSPKQKLATKEADTHRYLLYGGAAGGGKSYWIRWYIIRWLIKKFQETGQKGIVAGLFCEDYPAIKDRHMTKMKTEYPSWLGELKESSVYGLAFILSDELGGGVIALRNLDDPSKFQSSEFALIAVDELTKNTEDRFTFLRSRLRWAGIADTRFIAGTNPGGIGHDWVKKRWIEKRFEDNEQEAHEFAYVPATVDDNPFLAQSYILSLESLPERLKQAFRHGNWDVFEGQFFTEFDRTVHVVQSFPVPDSWIKIRGIDVGGREGITSCHWYAIDHDGNVWVYREYYATGRDSDQHADAITGLSKYYDPNLEQEVEEEYKYTVIDSAAFSKLGYPESIAEVYERHGVHGLIPASKARVHGWDIMHQYLRWESRLDEQGKMIVTKPPKLKVFDTCPNFIRTIPSLTHDEYNPQDVDTRGEDHAADECRYVLQTLREQVAVKPKSAAEKRLEQFKRMQRAERANYE